MIDLSKMKEEKKRKEKEKKKRNKSVLKWVIVSSKNKATLRGPKATFKYLSTDEQFFLLTRKPNKFYSGFIFQELNFQDF